MHPDIPLRVVLRRLMHPPEGLHFRQDFTQEMEVVEELEGAVRVAFG